MYSSIKYPYLSHGRDFWWEPPTPLEIPNKLHFLKFFGLSEPPTPPPQEFSIPSVGRECGYFLELHNAHIYCYSSFFFFLSFSAVLPFSVLPSSSLTSPGSFKTSVSTTNNDIKRNNSTSKPSESCEENPQASGGLVTAAPSPPDTKENSVKPQIAADPSKVSKNLGLENKENTTSEPKDTNSISSPESNNSSHSEEELMIIDQSPPPKVNTDKLTVSKSLLHIVIKLTVCKRKERKSLLWLTIIFQFYSKESRLGKKTTFEVNFFMFHLKVTSYWLLSIVVLVPRSRLLMTLWVFQNLKKAGGQV